VNRRSAEDRHAIGGNPAAIVRTPVLPSRCGRVEAPSMPLDLESLETSFDLVAPRGDELMDVFYKRLFATAPAVKPLFAGSDLRRQKAMLLGTLPA
jgi:hypothetical protein